jgi:hypothetical protein
MITAILAFLQAVPALMNGFTAFTSKYFDVKLKTYTARVGGDVTVAKAMLLAEVQNNQTKIGWLQAIASNPVLLFIVLGFAMPFIIYEWQAIVWDKVVMHGTTRTDPITGPLADWANIILSGIFVTSTGIGAAHAWINRK